MSMTLGTFAVVARRHRATRSAKDPPRFEDPLQPPPEAARDSFSPRGKSPRVFIPMTLSPSSLAWVARRPSRKANGRSGADAGGASPPRWRALPTPAELVDAGRGRDEGAVGGGGPPPGQKLGGLKKQNGPPPRPGRGSRSRRGDGPPRRPGQSCPIWVAAMDHRPGHPAGYTPSAELPCRGWIETLLAEVSPPRGRPRARGRARPP